eukprot:CAMPEP_0201692272 /NCGR_PEP_ID=MMETSP0578-20130828/5218_1 /ASSEMBLY_ACC=CAM_ASM_000663 /TAXON_ID=267565 /ORGANISM="Skeletonema grethea, Strain CCMP 1804" /LENGTH=188 /DNA_ID=CAMNT_0048177627 /DNA_START=55 /DNA_END=616 /DNA_ORIENTATION=+
MTDLIVPFPRQRQRQRQSQRRQRKHRKVQFAETAQLHIYEPHNIARRELWFTKTEYDLMKFAVQEDVRKVRAGRTSIDTAGSRDDAVRVSSGFWIGIASSPHTIMHRPGQGLQSTMHPSGPHRAGKTRPVCKFQQMGEYRACLFCSDKAARAESKEARKAPPRSPLRRGHAAQLTNYKALLILCYALV